MEIVKCGYCKQEFSEDDVYEIGLSVFKSKPPVTADICEECKLIVVKDIPSAIRIIFYDMIKSESDKNG